MAVPVSAFGLIFGSRSLSGSPIGGIPETQKISSRKGRFYAVPKSASQEENPCSVRRKTGYGIVQSIFSLATRREMLGKHLKGGRRGGGLKIDWTKPPGGA